MSSFAISFSSSFSLSTAYNQPSRRCFILRKSRSRLSSCFEFRRLQFSGEKSRRRIFLGCNCCTKGPGGIGSVLRTAWNIGKDGIEAGTNLVPVSVPRPVARISVTIAALAVSLFVLKSFLSTAFFVLGTMGFAYFLFIALNKDEAPKQRGQDNSSDSKPMDDPLEEAKKIMDKYK